MGFLHFFLIPTFERVPVEHGLRAGLELAILPICLSRPCFYHTQLPLLSYRASVTTSGSLNVWFCPSTNSFIDSL